MDGSAQEGMSSDGRSAFRLKEKVYRAHREDGGGGKRKKRSKSNDGQQGSSVEEIMSSPSVLDFDKLEREGVREAPVSVGGVVRQVPQEELRFGPHTDFINHPETVTVYELSAVPGFRLVRHSLSPVQQMNLVASCFCDYMAKPNRTNHDAVYGTERLPDNLFMAVHDGVSPSPPPSHSGEDGSGRPVPPLNTLLRKLRWTTLGCQYDWTTRKYPDVSVSPSVPKEFSEMVSGVASLVGLDVVAEAGIVNYYNANSTMCGHIDDAEYTFEHPIISYSLGHACVFLMGGSTREVEPQALLLRSGDCVVMGGQSRQCFHGVPRILEGQVPAFLQEDSDERIQARVPWPVIAKHMKTVHPRVNINARQVWPSTTDNK